MQDLIGFSQTIHFPPIRLRETMGRLSALGETLALIYHERSHESLEFSAGVDLPGLGVGGKSYRQRLAGLRLTAQSQNTRLVARDGPILTCLDIPERLRRWLEIMPRCLESVSRIDETELSDVGFSSRETPEDAELLEAQTLVAHWGAFLHRQIGERPRVFVASSSEGLPAARLVRARLGAHYDVRLWDDFFQPGWTTIERLEYAAGLHDFGVFVLTGDDVRLFRGEAAHVPRDNVLFELGIFVGRSSRRHALVIAPRELALPTDLEGVGTAHYLEDESRLEESLCLACDKVRASIDASLKAAAQQV